MDPRLLNNLAQAFTEPHNTSDEFNKLLLDWLQYTVEGIGSIPLEPSHNQIRIMVKN